MGAPPKAPIFYFIPLKTEINTANLSSKEAIYFLWDIQYHQPTQKNWELQKSA